ncbi:MAG: hypothetical protein QXW39_03175 [Candidatus Bathyarchaeia archaeon]
MKSKLLLGPFNKVYRDSGLLRFIVPDHLRSSIVEHSLKNGLKISPDKIFKAYKNQYGYFWIIVEFDKGYDLYKHFKLSDRDRHARRIPRIVVEACPRCGEDLVDGSCLECGEVKPRYLEVWRDPEALEELIGPVEKVEKSREKISFLVGESWIDVPRTFLHEYIVSMVKIEDKIYVKYLRISQSNNI